MMLVQVGESLWQLVRGRMAVPGFYIRPLSIEVDRLGRQRSKPYPTQKVSEEKFNQLRSKLCNLI
jgi:hypothetical protein